MAIKYIQLPVCKLSAFLGSAVTSFDVSGFLYNDGTTPVATTDIGDICYATLEPKTSREELISFTIDSVTSAGVATVTVTRGLSQSSPYGAGGASFDHQAGSDFVISNNPGLLNHFGAKDNDETITGDWKAPTPASATSIVNKTYADTKVSKTGDETIAGVKTFSSPITIVDGVADTDAVSKLQSETYADGLDTDNVKTSGDQTIADVKTFSSSPVIPDATAANQPYTKGQHDADAVASSAVASPTVRGTAKINVVADNPADPIVIGANFPINKSEKDGTPANDNGGIPKLENVDGEDAKLDPVFLGISKEKEDISTNESIDGSTLAVPIAINSSGRVIIANALESPTNNFLGFVKNDYTYDIPVYLSSGTISSAGSGSITANAGNNRVIIVFVYQVITNTVTGVTWNSIAGTEIANDSEPGNPDTMRMFTIPIGDSVSNQSNILTIIGGDGNTDVVAVVYENINQTTPYQGTAFDVNATTGTSVSTTTLTLIDDYGVVIGAAAGLSTSSINNVGFTNRANIGGIGEVGEFKIYNNDTIDAVRGSSGVIIASGLILNPSEIAQTINYQHSGVLDGFSGLTPSSKYYVQDVPGTVGTSPGTTNLLVGKAITATKLLILH